MITSELNRIPKGNNICFSENLSHMLSPEIRRVIVCVAQLTDWLTDTCVSKDMPAASACVCVWAQPWPPLFSFSPVLLALGIQHTSEAEKVKVTCPDAPNVLRRSSGSAPARWRWLSFFLEQPAICVRVWMENRRLNEPGSQNGRAATVGTEQWATHWSAAESNRIGSDPRMTHPATHSVWSALTCSTPWSWSRFFHRLSLSHMSTVTLSVPALSLSPSLGWNHSHARTARKEGLPLFRRRMSLQWAECKQTTNVAVKSL